jgi:nucleoside triphosphatase
MAMRLIVVGIVENRAGEILICRMPRDRGVFPGQWCLPGGGIEEGETAEIALRRELGEEVGLEVTNIRPLFFTDGVYPKTFPDGSRQEFYMVFLLFSCLAEKDLVRLNAEFEAYRWVKPEDLPGYNMNVETIKTFTQLGLLAHSSETGGNFEL